jgi:hypothetical protein
MTAIRKILTASLATVTLGVTMAATATPAAAWCGPHGCRGHHHGWGAGAAAAGIIGGLALGAIAASAAQPDYSTCLTRERVYDDYGRYVGTRRVRVAC